VIICSRLFCFPCRMTLIGRTRPPL
jgi:hypothetical protein